jgi:putative MATE family efflux protein
LTDPPESPLVARPIGPAMLSLAAPTIASLFLQAAFSIVNMAWVGRLGAAPLAAINTAAFIVWAVESLAAVCSVGTNALVARHVGAGHLETARETAGRAIGLALVVSLATTIAGLASIRALFAFMGTAPDVTRLGEQYLSVIFAGVFTVFVGATVEAAFRAHGDTRTPMKLLAGSLVANTLLDPFLIYGIGPFPRWGVAGAAIATVACRTVAAAIGLTLLYRRGLARPRAAIGLDVVQWHIARIGAPIALSQVSFCVVYMALTRVIAEFGTPAVAAVGIGHKTESLGYFVSVGFGFAAATMVGQNIGAGRPDRATRAAWIACGYATIAAALVTAVMLAAPVQIARVFIDDSQVIAVATEYMLIVAVSQVFMVLEIVLEGAFGGAGDTLPPLLVAGPLSIARVPAAYVLAVTLGWGVDGVWWAISLSTIFKGVFMAVWFARRYGPPWRGAG